jgi:hypothetical protein
MEALPLNMGITTDIECVVAILLILPIILITIIC